MCYAGEAQQVSYHERSNFRGSAFWERQKPANWEADALVKLILMPVSTSKTKVGPDYVYYAKN